jgi:predicted dehydrogenase
MKKSGKSSRNMSRRRFLGNTAAAAAFMIVPRHVLGGAGQIPPSEKVNVASVGAGGDMAPDNIHACAKVGNIVALCDVDDKQAAKIYNEFPKAAKYKDFRVMLDKSHKDIDGVVVAIPDHSHAVVTMAAIRAGKHVYTQKPMTHSIYEARILTEAARKAGIISQMGNQGRSSEGTRLVQEWINDGAIGTVREAHCWTDRPGSWWPQGIPRPTDTPAIPETLDWDIWLGPSPARPYNPCYHPFLWRGWWDFGTGSLGDMGCHMMDQPFFALKLSCPTSVEAFHSITAGGEALKKIESETAPNASVIRYEFPARGTMPPVSLTWYDGGMRPFPPAELEEGRNWPDNGILFVGDQGKMFVNMYGGNPRLIPEEKMQAYKQPDKTLPRVPGGVDGHEADWLRAIKDGKPTTSNFDLAGPLTETVLLGNLAVRFAGKKLLWDGPNMKVTNVPEADRFIRTPYRQGWSL